MKAGAFCTEEVAKAERSLIRAAMGVVNAEGWAFQLEGEKSVLCFPVAMRRLEVAILRLREARKVAAKARRKHGK